MAAAVLRKAAHQVARRKGVQHDTQRFHNRRPVSLFMMPDVAQAFGDGRRCCEMYRAFTLGEHDVQRGGIVHIKAQRVVF